MGKPLMANSTKGSTISQVFVSGTNGRNYYPEIKVISIVFSMV